MTNLRIPGPTPLPPEVREASSAQMINHRGPEFDALIKEVTANLKTVFQTKNDLYILTSSGSGGLESAVVNTLSPAIRYSAYPSALSATVFWTSPLLRRQSNPTGLRMGRTGRPGRHPPGTENRPAIKAVIMTHNETSTGVTNDIAAIAPIVREYDKLLLVDCVSSMSSLSIPVDELGIDVAVTGSQKGWMAPPGLPSSVSASVPGKPTRPPRCRASTGISPSARNTWKWVRTPLPRLSG